jgi:hypothetical protein
MKKMIYTVFVSMVLAVALSSAPIWAQSAPLPEKQWEAPVMPGGTIVKSEKKVVYIEYNLPYDQVLTWYKEALKTHRDPVYNIEWTKYKDRKDQMYIEEQGSAKWHSIGISKNDGAKTNVTIVQDNWTWIFSTLLIRFAGVFAVLCILWILLNINSYVMKKYFPRDEAKAEAK